jgi:TPR repeat protein
MNDAEQLRAAKDMVRANRFGEARAAFESLSKLDSIEGIDALYCLAIIHYTGSGVEKNSDEAIRYFILAHERGHLMASYQLAGIFEKTGELENAYKVYQWAAPHLPAAAYRAYLLLRANSRLDSDPNAREKYLVMAADQGHVLARRKMAVRVLLGREGWHKIPYGVFLVAKTTVNVFCAVVIKGDRLKYE